MEVFGIGQYQAVPNSYAPQKGEVAAPVEDTKAAGVRKDRVEISGSAKHRQAAALGESLPKAEAPETRNDVETKEKAEGGDQSGTGGCVGINAAKLARMLAAAKTRSQVQAVIAKIEADLDECEAGRAQGMDVDEASVRAAEQLLQEAKSKLASADDREATPEEEMASALASLM